MWRENDENAFTWRNLEAKSYLTISYIPSKFAEDSENCSFYEEQTSGESDSHSKHSFGAPFLSKAAELCQQLKSFGFKSWIQGMLQALESRDSFVPRKLEETCVAKSNSVRVTTYLELFRVIKGFDAVD